MSKKVARHLIEPRVTIFMKCHRLLYFANNFNQNIGKFDLENLVKKFLIMLKNLLQMHLKLYKKKEIEKTKEATRHLIGNKTAIKITKIHHRIIQKLLHKQKKNQ